MTSLCRTLECPYFSEGGKVDGVTYGYGCQKYTVSNMCPLNVIGIVTTNQYELFWDDGSVSPNHLEAASLILKYLVIKDDLTEYHEVPE